MKKLILIVITFTICIVIGVLTHDTSTQIPTISKKDQGNYSLTLDVFMPNSSFCRVELSVYVNLDTMTIGDTLKVGIVIYPNVNSSNNLPCWEVLKLKRDAVKKEQIVTQIYDAKLIGITFSKQVIVL